MIYSFIHFIPQVFSIAPSKTLSEYQGYTVDDKETHKLKAKDISHTHWKFDLHYKGTIGKLYAFLDEACNCVFEGAWEHGIEDIR